MIKISIIGILFCLIIIPISSANPNISGNNYPDLSDSRGISVSLVNQDPDPAIAGDTIEIYLGIENLGGETVNNLIVEIEPEYPFTLVEGESDKQKISTIKEYQKQDYMKIITYMLKVDSDASAGSYELNVIYHDESGSLTKETSVTIDVKSKEMAQIIRIDRTDLVPGEQSSLKFTLNNVGGAPLKDLTFNWVNEDKIILPVGSDNTKYIKYVDIGESVELEYQVIADPNADPGLYELKLYLRYDNPITFEEKVISTIAGVYVGGKTDFDISFSESTVDETSFSVANIGSNPAYSISIIIPEQDGWSVRGSRTSIVGNLDMGDYTTAGFNLIPPKDEVPLKIQIAYTDTSGKRDIIDTEVVLDSASINMAGLSKDTSTNSKGSETISRLTNVGIIFLLLAAVCTGYWYYNKRKKGKKIVRDNPGLTNEDL
jgi:hypothetical protein